VHFPGKNIDSEMSESKASQAQKKIKSTVNFVFYLCIRLLFKVHTTEVSERSQENKALLIITHHW